VLIRWIMVELAWRAYVSEGARIGLTPEAGGPPSRTKPRTHVRGHSPRLEGLRPVRTTDSRPWSKSVGKLRGHGDVFLTPATFAPLPMIMLCS
jgi:hypothetical protein